jgi:dissimilatory sulfite reductase related protein
MGVGSEASVDEADRHDLPVGERTVALTGGGFLIDTTEWDEDVALAIATRYGVAPLTDEHWSVIRTIRDYYLRFDTPPMPRLITRRTGFDKDKLLELFLTSCPDCMCRIAGLPKPTG